MRCTRNRFANFLPVSPIGKLFASFTDEGVDNGIDVNVSLILKVLLGKHTEGVLVTKRHVVHLEREQLVALEACPH